MEFEGSRAGQLNAWRIKLYIYWEITKEFREFVRQEPNNSVYLAS